MELIKPLSMEEGEEVKVKRPQNAYFLFCQEQRPVLQQQNPDILLKDINRQLGEKWKALSADEKAIYISRAAACNQEFKENHPNYHYERSKKVVKYIPYPDPNTKYNLAEFVTESYTIEQIQHFMKPGETTLNFQYNDNITHP